MGEDKKAKEVKAEAKEVAVTITNRTGRKVKVPKDIANVMKQNNETL